MTSSHVEQAVAARIEAARRKAEADKQRRAELAAARTAGLTKRHVQRLRNQGQVQGGFGVKTYRRHPCDAVHPTWGSLAACIWPASEIAGDGPFAAVACSARTVTLYAALPSALAGKRGLDSDGCGADCRRRHQVIAFDPGPERSGAAA